MDSSPLQGMLVMDPAQTPDEVRLAVVKLSGQLATRQRLGLPGLEGGMENCHRAGGRGQNQGYSGDPPCTHCHRRGHSVEACWTKFPERRPDWAPKPREALQVPQEACWSCGQMGHRAALCPNHPRPAPPNRPPPTGPPASTPEGGVNVVSEELQSFLFNTGA